MLTLFSAVHGSDTHHEIAAIDNAPLYLYSAAILSLLLAFFSLCQHDPALKKVHDSATSLQLYEAHLPKKVSNRRRDASFLFFCPLLLSAGTRKNTTAICNSRATASPVDSRVPLYGRPQAHVDKVDEHASSSPTATVMH